MANGNPVVWTKPPVNVVGTNLARKAVTGTPQLTYRGGPLLANVEVTTIFWGSAWSADPLRAQLDAFFDFIVGSSLIDQLSEYNVTGYTIGHGSHVASLVVAQDPPATVDDAAIQTFVQSLVFNGSVPAQDVNSLYFVFTPSGVVVTLQGAASCQQFCGYHSSPDGQLFYAVVPYPDCAGCLFASTVFDSMTVVASHELCEAITDANPGTGWYDDANGEIGDICEGSNKTITAASVKAAIGPIASVSVSPTSVVLGSAPINLTVTLTPQVGGGGPAASYVVQTEWSNAQGQCI
jgi:hypothetical protein